MGRGLTVKHLDRMTRNPVLRRERLRHCLSFRQTYRRLAYEVTRSPTRPYHHPNGISRDDLRNGRPDSEYFSHWTSYRDRDAGGEFPSLMEAEISLEVLRVAIGSLARFGVCRSSRSAIAV